MVQSSNISTVLGAISVSRFGSKFLAAAKRASRGARGSRSRSPLGLGRGETGNLGMCLGVDSGLMGCCKLLQVVGVDFLTISDYNCRLA